MWPLLLSCWARNRRRLKETTNPTNRMSLPPFNSLMSCFKYSFFTHAKTLVLEVLICPREIAPRESRRIQPGDRTHWFSNLADELLIKKPSGRAVPNSSETCMSKLNHKSHSRRVAWMWHLNVPFYNSTTTISPCLRQISNAPCAHLQLCTSRWLLFGLPSIAWIHSIDSRLEASSGLRPGQPLVLHTCLITVRMVFWNLEALL